MHILSSRQTIIANKKKANSFRDFLQDIPSRYPLVLYKQDDLISLYPETERSCPVISHRAFDEEIPSLIQHGMDYDIDQSFFKNFQQLFLAVPFSALYNYSGAENSDYSFSVLNSKNCYLSFTVITDCENIVYSFAIKEGCRNVFASAQVSNHSENIWNSVCVIKSYQVFYSKFIENSSDIWFSANMVGCHECLFCDGLTNQSYCIHNEQLDKETYLERKRELLSDTSRFGEYYGSLTGHGNNAGSTAIVDGNFVLNSQDVEYGMYSFNLKSARNTLVVGSPNQNEYIYDAFEAGSLGNSHFYGVINTGVNSEHVYNCEGIVTCYNVYYSRFLENCNHCLGCIGLRNQEYCILNKQYTKEEWFAMVEKIFVQMHEQGVLGDYFPGWVNPFYFNDTIASLVGDFTKDEVLEQGYMRRDEQIAVDVPERMDVVEVRDLGQYEGYDDADNWMIDPTILKKVIRDEQGNVYRVIKMEYDFLMKYGLPLPRKHWLERLKEHFRVQ